MAIDGLQRTAVRLPPELVLLFLAVEFATQAFDNFLSWIRLIEIGSLQNPVVLFSIHSVTNILKRSCS